MDADILFEPYKHENNYCNFYGYLLFKAKMLDENIAKKSYLVKFLYNMSKKTSCETMKKILANKNNIDEYYINYSSFNQMVKNEDFGRNIYLNKFKRAVINVYKKMLLMKVPLVNKDKNNQIITNKKTSHNYILTQNNTVKSEIEHIKSNQNIKESIKLDICIDISKMIYRLTQADGSPDLLWEIDKDLLLEDYDDLKALNSAKIDQNKLNKVKNDIDKILSRFTIKQETTQDPSLGTKSYFYTPENDKEQILAFVLDSQNLSIISTKGVYKFEPQSAVALLKMGAFSSRYISFDYDESFVFFSMKFFTSNPQINKFFKEPFEISQNRFDELVDMLLTSNDSKIYPIYKAIDEFMALDMTEMDFLLKNTDDFYKNPLYFKNIKEYFVRCLADELQADAEILKTNLYLDRLKAKCFFYQDFAKDSFLKEYVLNFLKVEDFEKEVQRAILKTKTYINLCLKNGYQTIYKTEQNMTKQLDIKDELKAALVRNLSHKEASQSDIALLASKVRASLKCNILENFTQNRFSFSHFLENF